MAQPQIESIEAVAVMYAREGADVAITALPSEKRHADDIFSIASRPSFFLRPAPGSNVAASRPIMDACAKLSSLAGVDRRF